MAIPTQTPGGPNVAPPPPPPIGYDPYGPSFDPGYVTPPPPPQQSVGSLIGPGTYQTNNVTGSSTPTYSINNPDNAANYTTGSYQPTADQQAWMAAEIERNAIANGINVPPPPPGGGGSSFGGSSFLPPPPPPPSGGDTGSVRPPTLPPPPPLPLTPFSGPVTQNFGSGGRSMFSNSGGGGSFGPRSPMASNFRPSVPLWARGLQRSPYQQMQMRNGQSSLFGFGFQPEMPVEDPDEMRRRREAMMSGEAPAWTMPA